MLLIPEIETVVILVPKAASTSIKKAVLKRYPKTIALYRHMEADGVPAGYDRWHKVGVVREPLARLWGLYHHLQSLSGDYDPGYMESMRASVDRPFEEWVLNNEAIFTESTGSEGFYAKYSVKHPTPETKKSQFKYLRPDLGTEVYQFARLDELARDLDIDLGHHNGSGAGPVPDVWQNVGKHMAAYFQWDLTWCEGAWQTLEDEWDYKRPEGM